MNLKKICLSSLSALTLFSLASCGTQSVSNLTSSENKGFSILSEEDDKVLENEARKLNPQAISTDRIVNRELSKHKLNFNHTAKNLLVASAKGSTVSLLSIASVDNRKWCSPVANQGRLGSCTAFAAVKGAREYLMNKNTNAYTPLSALMFYYEERKEDGTVSFDAGSTITRSASVLKNVGASKETTWPYDISKFTVAPPTSAYTEAKQYTVNTTTRLASLADIKTAVQKGDPVIFGIRVYESFMKATNGVIPVPNTKTERLLGGHAISCFGFDDAKQVLIMKNSWGTGWGMGGYFTLPYGYFTGNLVMDVWTVT